MQDYEAKIAPHKDALFSKLFDALQDLNTANTAPTRLLEVGIGTAPNLEFYAGKVCCGVFYHSVYRRHVMCSEF